MGLDLDLDSQRTARATQPDALVNESHKTLNLVQHRLNFQLSGWCFVFHTRFNPESVKQSQPLFLSARPGTFGSFPSPPPNNTFLPPNPKEAGERIKASRGGRLLSRSSRPPAIQVLRLSLLPFSPTDCTTEPDFLG